jgi:hypothetical protein
MYYFKMIDDLFWGLEAIPVLGLPSRRPRDNQIATFDFKKFNFFGCKIFTIFGHQNPGSGSPLKPMRTHITGYNEQSSFKQYLL